VHRDTGPCKSGVKDQTLTPVSEKCETIRRNVFLLTIINYKKNTSFKRLSYTYVHGSCIMEVSTDLTVMGKTKICQRIFLEGQSI
jgi:hypothetical protein